jgi:predicted nucleic acid-binding protein
MAVFVDTGAWFAYFVRRDPNHRAATAWMRRNRQSLVTTDYILDELLTLVSWRKRAGAIENVWPTHRIGIAVQQEA